MGTEEGLCPQNQRLRDSSTQCLGHEQLNLNPAVIALALRS